MKSNSYANICLSLKYYEEKQWQLPAELFAAQFTLCVVGLFTYLFEGYFCHFGCFHN